MEDLKKQLETRQRSLSTARRIRDLLDNPNEDNKNQTEEETIERYLARVERLDEIIEELTNRIETSFDDAAEHYLKLCVVLGIATLIDSGSDLNKMIIDRGDELREILGGELGDKVKKARKTIDGSIMKVESIDDLIGQKREEISGIHEKIAIGSSEQLLQELQGANEELETMEQGKNGTLLLRARNILVTVPEPEDLIIEIDNLLASLSEPIKSEAGAGIDIRKINFQILPVEPVGPAPETEKEEDKEKPTMERTGKGDVYVERVKFIVGLKPKQVFVVELEAEKRRRGYPELDIEKIVSQENEERFQELIQEIGENYGGFMFDSVVVLCSLYAIDAVYVIPAGKEWKDDAAQFKSTIRLRGALRLKNIKGWEGVLKKIVRGELDITKKKKKKKVKTERATGEIKVIDRAAEAVQKEILEKMGITIGEGESAEEELKKIAQGDQQSVVKTLIDFSREEDGITVFLERKRGISFSKNSAGGYFSAAGILNFTLEKIGIVPQREDIALMLQKFRGSEFFKNTDDFWHYKFLGFFKWTFLEGDNPTDFIKIVRENPERVKEVIITHVDERYSGFNELIENNFSAVRSLLVRRKEKSDNLSVLNYLCKPLGVVWTEAEVTKVSGWIKKKSEEEKVRDWNEKLKRTILDELPEGSTCPSLLAASEAERAIINIIIKYGSPTKFILEKGLGNFKHDIKGGTAVYFRLVYDNVPEDRWKKHFPSKGRQFSSKRSRKYLAELDQ